MGVQTQRVKRQLTELDEFDLYYNSEYNVQKTGSHEYGV